MKKGQIKIKTAAQVCRDIKKNKKETLAFRKAANIMERAARYYRKNKICPRYMGGIDAEYSCNAILSYDREVSLDKYNELYGNRYFNYPSGDVWYSIDSTKISPKEKTFQTQLHRALMLDFYAEMVKKGDW